MKTTSERQVRIDSGFRSPGRAVPRALMFLLVLALGMLLAGCGGDSDSGADSEASDGSSLEASMAAYAEAMASGDCPTAGSYTVSGTDPNCASRPDHYASPGYFKIGRIVEAGAARANVEMVYRCSSCESEAGGFLRAVEQDGRWLLDMGYNDGSYIDDEAARAGEG